MSSLKETDTFKISDDEATELCVHHLRMAGMLFMNTPGDNGVSLRAEIKRQIADRTYEGDSIVPASEAFVKIMTEYYAKEGL